MPDGEELVRQGLLEEVAPDSVAADAEIEQAQRHLEAARAIAEIDANGAYQLAYDAARKAAVAHLRAAGLRVRQNAPGGHAITARYVRAAIDDRMGRRLDSMRRKRNRSEYDVAYFGSREVTEVIGYANELVIEVTRRLAGLQ